MNNGLGGGLCYLPLQYKVMTLNVLKLTSPIPPSVNHYLAYRTVMKGGRPLSISYKTSEAIKFGKDFSEYVIREVEAQGWDWVPNKTQHFYVDAVFYFPRVDMDANNYWKVLLDTITDTQKIWVDDNVVCERVQRIFYDSVNPRVELEIKPVDYIGVFQDASQLEEFTSRCVGCNRYTRNCSILNKAISGSIQADIVSGVCEKYKCKK